MKLKQKDINIILQFDRYDYIERESPERERGQLRTVTSHLVECGEIEINCATLFNRGASPLNGCWWEEKRK